LSAILLSAQPEHQPPPPASDAEEHHHPCLSHYRLASVFRAPSISNSFLSTSLDAIDLCGTISFSSLPSNGNVLRKPGKLQLD